MDESVALDIVLSAASSSPMSPHASPGRPRASHARKRQAPCELFSGCVITPPLRPPCAAPSGSGSLPRRAHAGPSKRQRTHEHAVDNMVGSIERSVSTALSLPFQWCVHCRRLRPGLVSRGWSSLHFAAFYGHVACLKALVNAGEDVHAYAKDGDTVLEKAILGRSGDHLECIAVLIARGAVCSHGPDLYFGCSSSIWSTLVVGLKQRHMQLAEDLSRYLHKDVANIVLKYDQRNDWLHELQRVTVHDTVCNDDYCGWEPTSDQRKHTHRSFTVPPAPSPAYITFKQSFSSPSLQPLAASIPEIPPILRPRPPRRPGVFGLDEGDMDAAPDSLLASYAFHIGNT